METDPFLSSGHVEKRGPVRRGRVPSADLAGHEEALVEAAAATFVEHGYGGSSVDRLAAAARVSTKTIYGRFGGKAGLFEAVMKRMAAGVLPRFEALLAADGPPDRVLPDFGEALLDLALSPDAVALQRAVTAEAGRFPVFARTFYELGPARGIAILAGYLGRQAAGGRLAIADPQAAAEQFIGLVHGETLRRGLLAVEPPPDPSARRDQARRAADLFLRACRSGTG